MQVSVIAAMQVSDCQKCFHKSGWKSFVSGSKDEEMPTVYDRNTQTTGLNPSGEIRTHRNIF